MNTKLIINGNAVYELDMICKEKEKREKKKVATQAEEGKIKSNHKRGK